MLEFLLFGLSVGLSFAAWAYLCGRYVWPRVRSLELSDAVRPLLVLHLFRFIGLSFLIPGVAGAALGRDFSEPGAFGDLLATVLAWVTLARLKPGKGVAMAWAFNIWGTADLLYAFYKGAFGAGFHPGFLGATFFIPTFCVPLLMCSHIMIFMLLTRRSTAGSMLAERAPPPARAR